MSLPHTSKVARIPLYYTFGNHMHWVDMEWLWGYHVLPGSVRDMLRFCQETGAKGNVNFDGVGYEKLAAEDPEALAELRAAIQAGTIEPVGCSYGQPYGLFHGGESNVRQRVYGVRTAMRLLGARPRTFWEEEFDFFPQLPQMLKGVGFEYASLFFQWTWHTPEIPKEEIPVLLWEGQDGSRLVCATRNHLNLHQWPEDMDLTFATLAEEANDEDHPPLILQWLELMPSPDWMCRSELLLPKMKELLADDRFEIRMTTLGEYLHGCGMGVSPMVSTDVSSVSLPAEESELKTRQGAYLPHWTKEGGIYAVTFRLDDALPAAVREEYRQEREHLRKLHEAGRLTSAAAAYEYLRLYSEKVEKKLDQGYGSCVLKDPACAEIVAQAMRHFDGERYALFGWCVMPNHVHVVLKPLPNNDLPEILHSWKSFTAHKINQRLGREGTLWQTEYYDHLVRDGEDLTGQLSYVARNPQEAGLANWPWAWVKENHDRDGRENHGRDAHPTLPVRFYSMDEVWHGMSLGKNGDFMRRQSRIAESNLLFAEMVSAVNGLFGRPYAQWDVYPTWELEEAWRELLAAQHHDNDECEGLCGHGGRFGYDRARKLSNHVLATNLKRFAEQFAPEGASIRRFGPTRTLEDETTPRQEGKPERHHVVVTNPLGWEIQTAVRLESSIQDVVLVTVPAFGCAVVNTERLSVEKTLRLKNDEYGELAVGNLRVEALLSEGNIRQIRSAHFPEGVFAEDGAFNMRLRRKKDEKTILPPKIETFSSENPRTVGFRKIYDGIDDISLSASLSRAAEAVDIHIYGHIEKPDPGMNDGLQTSFHLNFRPKIFTDQPYGISLVRPVAKGLKKYPEGDWMTSRQWFEEVHRPFTALSFVDLVDADNPDRGLLVIHDGSQQWFLDPETRTVRCLLNMYDPWDEDYFRGSVDTHMQLIPHGPITNSQRWKLAQQFLRQPSRCFFSGEPVGPPNFSALSCDAPNVVPTALYRETEDYSGKHLDNYAGRGMGYPYVVRLVEFDGIETEATLQVAGTVAKAYKTNLLGEIEEELKDLKVKMRPYEIATLYLDIVEGRKQTRDLDAKREIWATVHRVD